MRHSILSFLFICLGIESLANPVDLSAEDRQKHLVNFYTEIEGRWAAVPAQESSDYYVIEYKFDGVSVNLAGEFQKTDEDGQVWSSILSGQYDVVSGNLFTVNGDKYPLELLELKESKVSFADGPFTTTLHLVDRDTLVQTVALQDSTNDEKDTTLFKRQ